MIEKGYYYHYKRDDSKAWNDAMYEVVGTAWNTELPGFHSDNPSDYEPYEMVVYRTLYEEAVTYQNGKRLWIRPAKMWFEFVEWNGEQTTRFVRVIDPEMIARLDEKRREMYND